MSISSLYKKRQIFFNKIVKNFDHVKVSDLIVAHKIDKKIFKKIQKSALNYFLSSKKYLLTNLTPNGRLSPKKEIEKEFNDFIINYFSLIKSIKLDKLLKNYLPPVLRYKEKKLNLFNKKNKKRSELPHADTWAGWTDDYLLFLMPLAGDIKNNKIKFFKVPTNINKDWMIKKKFTEINKKIKNNLIPVKDHYKLGYLYVLDITVPHVTIRNKNSKDRLSIDSPLQFKTNFKENKNYKLTNYITSKDNFISSSKANFLNKKYIFTCLYHMGEVEKTKGKNSKPAFVLKKIK